MTKQLETATFGGGCFWCTEAVFQQLQGVEKVVSGYAGGRVENPSYREVCSGSTGHAEVIQVTYDPATISYRDLLDVFLQTHDPTTPNRQGADVGTQYRSIILYQNDEEKAIAQQAIAETDAARVFDASIVTEITPLDRFYAAEEYHQDYFNSNPYQPYCQIVINPKVRKFRKSFGEKLKV
jgi:peptide-methionine (S)-S-oxide reductase